MIREVLADERVRRDALERRGAQVVTTVAAIAGIVVALSGSTLGGSAPRFSNDGWLFVLSFAALGVAALLGVFVSWPLAYQEVDEADLERLTDPVFWDAAGSIGERRAAEARIAVIKSARRQNGRKAIVLFAAMSIEVVAFAGLVVSWVASSRP